MLEFSKINAFDGGQRASFEELLCQLAQREKFPNGSRYRRVEGAGGDGGVEAYWTLPTGKKVGYQAKFFLRAGDIDWAQIDKSVLQAIATHPELERYVVGLPCDLTDKRGKARKDSKSGWEHWEKHKKDWEQAALANGLSHIDFVAWPKSEINSRLIAKGAEGLREFFFGGVELSQEWFQNQLDQAVAALDERYHPEDHVNIRLQTLFSTITRSAASRNKLSTTLNAVCQFTLPGGEIASLSAQPDVIILENLKKTHADLNAISEDFDLSPAQRWDVDNWINKLTALENATSALNSWCWSQSRNLKDNSRDETTLRRCIDELAKLSSLISDFDDTIRSPYMIAENQRLAIVRGAAGAGKSHLFAQCSADALKAGQPALLFLGQRFNDTELWTQIAGQLGLPGRTPDQILGALDAAGTASGVRCLISIDAINEGVGSRYWKNHIAPFIQMLQSYAGVCCVVSCRTEYFDAAVPDSTASKYRIFDIRGFETSEEQLAAARVYLDKRGIARPSTPWLAPEFINPLFLRSVCVSLERDGKSEFPSGLTGTKKILKYYLESMGRNIQANEDSAVSLVSKLGRTAQEIAARMLADRTDFLALDKCREAIAIHFGDITPRSENEWLSIILRNGLLRKDPNPDASDEVFADPDVVRFSFQRFQDFLMAEKAVEDISDPAGIFDENQALNFCIDAKSHVAWQWRGLLDALSTVLPEKFGKELVDCMPGAANQWWKDWGIREGFKESVKWRERSAFSDRSLELLNKLGGSDSLDILIQIAVSADHPWNAELLHRNLEKRKLPHRDASWTNWVNAQDSDPDSNVGVLIEWCLTGQAPNTNPQNRFLAALSLCWFFSTTNRRVRDKATKALSNLLLVEEGIFVELLARFAKVDDPYVLERLLAAGYGACCRKPEAGKLNLYSQAVYSHLFENRSPPYGMLLRDYAQGIVELAEYHSSLPVAVDIQVCKPPYKSPKPRLSVSEEQLNIVAQNAGDDSIASSSTSSMADFAQYEIGSRTHDFLTVPLHKERPLTAKHKLKIFEKEIVTSNSERMVAFEKLEKTANPYWYGLYSIEWGRRVSKPSKAEVKRWENDLDAARLNFLGLLSAEEIKRYENEAVPGLYPAKKETKPPEKFNQGSLRRWVAKRAYDFGWTKARFPHDSSGRGDYSRDRPMIERIGKKYQWLALDELLCRLADNYWLDTGFDDPPFAYRRATDIGFRRDIDATITEDREKRLNSDEAGSQWFFEPVIKLPSVEEQTLTKWPFEQDPASELGRMPFRVDETGKRWLVVYEHQSQSEKYSQDRRGEHGLRLQEFRFLSAVKVKLTDARTVAKAFEKKQQIDIQHWSIPEMTDSAFLYEAPWRSTWPQDGWRYDNWRVPTGIPYAQLGARYHWESHLDASLPSGYSAYIPAPWLARELGLQPDFAELGAWKDAEDKIAFRQFFGEDGSVVALLSEDHLSRTIGEDCTFLTVMIAERNSWPGGSNHHAAWRRSEGVCWRDGRGINKLLWKRDTRNGTSDLTGTDA
ncbi:MULTISPECIES: hypothetical protein [unclassified Rhizobium]|jgi:hypothetical protein|uniref:hypothetical protein n=1 Tax=unclassified Rhizobium TaxID=2613769 RepID=UPI00068E4969|nr:MULTISPECIES: hypothetical protein [unclassified Rhizobium]OJY69005.1 MAG: hypothetical protein BGP09_10085 [Rhizobium sp. 60-20]RKD74217.1 hypothetical protein BJ928_101567 [Rhizobium sp. WW_1]